MATILKIGGLIATRQRTTRRASKGIARRSASAACQHRDTSRRLARQRSVGRSRISLTQLRTASAFGTRQKGTKTSTRNGAICGIQVFIDFQRRQTRSILTELNLPHVPRFDCDVRPNNSRSPAFKPDCIFPNSGQV